MSSAAEPALSQNSQQLSLEKISIPVSNCLALDVYSSTKPHNLKIASLQKGLIFVCDATEKVGEGTGFGFPVLVCPEETYFSGSATVNLSKSSKGIMVRKEFVMDRTARNKLGNVRLKNQQTRAFIRYLCNLYQGNRHFRFPFLMLKEFIVNMGVEAAFEETEPVGKVSISYEIRGNAVRVQVDLSQIEEKHRKKVFILNEQSASFFRRYHDSHGAALVDGQIGAWDNVNAEWACFTDAQGQVGFRLWQAKDAVFRRGREIMRDCLDWAGLDYEVNPDIEVFEYRIELVEGAKSTW